jgi:glycosyltransferase involved in cell wall biosynthesis
LLFPIDWPEPFGLVMIEAMACGTPVIAYRGGAVSEVMEQGNTGFIVKGLEDAVEAVRRVPELSRKRCREVFEQRFTATRMAQDYLQVYEQLIKRKFAIPSQSGFSVGQAKTSEAPPQFG